MGTETLSPAAQVVVDQLDKPFGPDRGDISGFNQNVIERLEVTGIIAREVAREALQYVLDTLEQEHTEKKARCAKGLQVDREKTYQIQLKHATPPVESRNYEQIIEMLENNSGMCNIRDIRIQKLLVDAIIQSGNLSYAARIIGSIYYFDESIKESVMTPLLTKATTAQLVLAITHVGKISAEENKLCARLLEIGTIDDLIAVLGHPESRLDEHITKLAERVFETSEGMQTFIAALRSKEQGSEAQAQLLRVAHTYACGRLFLEIVDQVQIDTKVLERKQRTSGVIPRIIAVRQALKEARSPRG